MTGYNKINQQINNAIALLCNDQLVVIPTETVYGLAANAFSDKAIDKIFKLKNRPLNNPLIVHIASIDYLSQIAINIPSQALLLAHHFWPGPLTLVLEKSDMISSKISANRNTVGVRMPDHKVTLELLKHLDFPLVAPSANASNHISPTLPEHVIHSLGINTPYILEGGKCKKGLESTIVGFENGLPIIYRLGAIDKKEIEHVLGCAIKLSSEKHTLLAPGMMKKHYSPKTPFIVTADLESEIKAYVHKKVGLVCFSKLDDKYKGFPFRVLSQNQNLLEAASNLYSSMHELDQMNLDLIIAELLPNHGLGESVNDRLHRASVNVSNF
jgi:L-threonylcarbamoyladenylate synthase